MVSWPWRNTQSASLIANMAECIEHRTPFYISAMVADPQCATGVNFLVKRISSLLFNCPVLRDRTLRCHDSSSELIMMRFFRVHVFFYETERVIDFRNHDLAASETFLETVRPTCMTDLPEMANTIDSSLQFSGRAAPEARLAPWDAYERSNGQFSRRKFTDFMISTANTFQLEQILWQRHKLNFRVSGGGGGRIAAPGCQFSTLSFPRSLPSARVDCFSRGREQIRARWKRDVF